MGHLDTVQKILRLNATRAEKRKNPLDPNGKLYGHPGSTNFWPPRFWAAVKGDEVMVEILLTISTIQVDFTCPFGRTPLFYAAERGYVGITRLLLEAGANPNAVDNLGQTALHWAGLPKWISPSGNGILDEFRRSISPSAPLLICEVELLFDPQIPHSIAWSEIGVYGDSCSFDDAFKSSHPPSGPSAGENYAEVLALSLHHEADIDIADSAFQTPLTAAVACSYRSLVKLLVDGGAALQHTDHSRRSPLSNAAEVGHKDPRNFCSSEVPQ